MIVLNINEQEEIFIQHKGELIRVKIISIKSGRVKIGVDAKSKVKIKKQENEYLYK